MDYVIIVLSVIIFNSTVFYYMAQIFEYKRSTTAFLIQINMINSPIFVIEILMVPPEYTAVSILAFILVLFCEMKLIFKVPTLVSIFGAMCFAINFFSLRTIVLCVNSLYTDTAMFDILSEIRGRMLVCGIAAGIGATYLILTKKILSAEKMKAVIEYKKNFAFSTVLLVITLVYMILMSFSFSKPIQDHAIVIMNLKGAFLCILCYFNSMLCAYFFSKFKGYITDYEIRTKELDEKEELLDILEEKATYDQFTGLRNRKYGKQMLEQYIEEKQKFFVIFIDLDELKVVNDKYGHREGDFYIKTAADIINEVYKMDISIRFGGDEFLVIGKMGRDSYMPLKKAMKCSENIKKLGKNSGKKYNTSVSHGIVVVDERNTLAGAEIIKIADERMYEYKKKQKKQRVVKRI